MADKKRMINKRRKIIYDMMCENCDHVWTPRIDNPKSCPQCKKRFYDQKDRRKK